MKYEIMRRNIEADAKKISDNKTGRMFLDCFYNSLETSTELLPDGTAYVFTGDIPAMWLRDSSVQVMGYADYADIDSDVKTLIKGLLKRQWEFICMDPYANAFNHTPHPARHVDETNYLSPYVWERKYEVDSLCYPLWLALKYYGVTNDLSIFDDGFFKAFGTVINTFETEQEHDEKSPYYFRRTGPYASDTLDNGGKGALTARCGLTWSAFRPSDDRCVYHYLIPANIMAASVLNRLSAIILKAFPIESALAKRAEKLAESINRGIEKHGIILHPEFGKMYAYEVDGRGNYLLMDDANVPSLLSLPYLECLDSDDPIYQNTRKFVLSKSNPYFYKGKAAEGIGSPHTPDDYIWHIGIVIRLLTSTDRAEMKACFDMLINTDGGKGLMHESFDKDNPEKFTREWFGWANTLFGLATHKMLKEGFKI